MRLLLDTHVWIWSSLEPNKIASRVALEIANAEHDRYLSPVSVWEMVMLLERKRIHLNKDFGEWFIQSKQDLNLLEAPVTWEVAQELRFTMLGYRDPGDRFLVATAKAFDMTLVTADERLMNVPGLSVLPNR